MKLYVGIDLHGNNNVAIVADKENRVIARKKLVNEMPSVLEFLAPYQKDIVGIAIESTYNWYWLVDGLMSAGYKVHLANPAAMQQYSGLKHCDDNTDARWLAHMLALNILPQGYIYPKEERAVRDLLRKRSQLVRFRTSNILSINNLFTRNTGKGIRCKEIVHLTEDTVAGCFKDEILSMAVNANLNVLDTLDKEIDKLEKKIRSIVKLKPEFSNLKTVNGIGDILALTISLETGDISRFQDAGHFSSYCRCVKTERISNGKKKGEGNGKNGNKFLSWAFVEAANFVVRYNDIAKAFYQRKASKKNQAVAKKAVANKLSKACFYIMRDRVPFDEKKCFQTG